MPSMKPVGPLSYQGALQPQVTPEDAAAATHTLKVVHSSDPHARCSVGGGLGGARLHMVPSHGTDCVLTVRCDDAAVAPGCIEMDATAARNCRLAFGDTYDFSVFRPPKSSAFELSHVCGEVHVLGDEDDDALPEDPVGMVLDGSRLAGAVSKRCLGQVLAVNEGLIVRLDGLRCAVRVAATETLTPEAVVDAPIGHHCYRGLFTAHTAVYLQPRPGSALTLQGGRALPPPGCNVTTTLEVTTSDGETFPVSRALLRPCLALTAAVRDLERRSVAVETGCLTFDRVLIYLEGQHLGRPAPDYGVHLLPELLLAAQQLGLGSLAAHCEAKMGSAQARQRVFSFQEVKAANAAGACIILLDGMVLDVTRWLEEHPGGSAIIPQQGLNRDCCRFYEVYHSSRESFLYLQEFYHGELATEDLEAVPCAEPASSDFMAQLREYTGFRMPREPRVHKSF